MLSFPKWMNVRSFVITGKNGIWNTKKFSLLTRARSFIASFDNFLIIQLFINATSLSWGFSLCSPPVCLIMYGYIDEKTDVDRRLTQYRLLALEIREGVWGEMILERDKSAHQSLLVHKWYTSLRSRGWTEKRTNCLPELDDILKDVI